MFWDCLYSHFIEQTEKTTDQNIVHVLLFGSFKDSLLFGSFNDSLLFGSFNDSLLFGSFNDSLSPFQTNVACR